MLTRSIIRSFIHNGLFKYINTNPIKYLFSTTNNAYDTFVLNPLIKHTA